MEPSAFGDVERLSEHLGRSALDAQTSRAEAKLDRLVARLFDANCALIAALSDLDRKEPE